MSRSKVFKNAVGKFAAAVLLLVVVLVGSPIAQAVPVTVQELSTNPNRIVNIQVPGFYSGNAYAGVVNMLVDGVETQGFCIDPFHFSSRNPLQYEVVPLEDAPKALAGVFPGEMGEAKADQIERLWAMAYLPGSATWGSSAAAALQIAIWEIVAGDRFAVIGNDYGASALLNQLQSYTGPAAKLVGLTGPGQDYVVSKVPEAGATLLMLSTAFVALLMLKRWPAA